MKNTLLALFFLIIPLLSQGQMIQSEQTKASSPAVALFKSFVLPGWGHFSLGESHYSRAYVHLGLETALVLSYFGIDLQTARLQQNLYAYVELNAGTSIRNRDRKYALALTQFKNLDAYNDYQMRSRNWNAFITDTPANQWQWKSTQAQARYIKIRNNIDTNKQQLPILISLMVVNRVVSGVSAFIRARDAQSAYVNARASTISFSPVSSMEGFSGIQAHLYFSF